MKLNLKVRFKNPVFIFQLVLTAFAPILAYTGLSWEGLTTWQSVCDLIVQAYSNPFLCGLVAIALYNQLTDPTTRGHLDTSQVMKYDKPKDDGKW
ncbi:phage holin [Psychrobacillus sp. NPDC093200]|uniref:phage holin n=1 Tax=Psychrobacillus sp. NPDC093200 TaxID=3390656 RepID=UPI003D008E40